MNTVETELHARLGRALSALGRHDEAEAELARALEAGAGGDERVDWIIRRVWCLLAGERLEEAAGALLDAIAATPHEPRLWCELVDLALVVGDPPLALDVLSASEVVPTLTSPELLHRRALLEIAAGHPEAALVLLGELQAMVEATPEAQAELERIEQIAWSLVADRADHQEA